MATPDSKMANDLLARPFTADYEPQAIMGFGYFMASSTLPVFSPFWIPQMLRCHRVQFGLRMLKGPILAASRFYIDDEDSRGDKHSPLKQFLVRNITRFWRQSAIKALRAIEWGYSGNEAIYKLVDNEIHFDCLKTLHPTDCNVVTKDGEKAGISVQRVKHKTHRTYLGGPKALWHVVERETSPWYGLSRLFGAFQPWMEFYSDGGAKDIRRLYYHKYAFSGDVGYYPIGTEPGESANYAISNKDIMRSILEKRKSGGVVMFPNTIDPTTGQRKWAIEPSQGGPGSVDILAYHSDLKREIFEGMGIPSEVVEAAETGSGWSGRMVPATAFFSMLQELVNWLIFDFDQQVLRPLITLNYHIREPQYEIVPFGLLKGPNDSNEDEEPEVGALPGSQQSPGSQVPEDRRSAAQFSLCV